MLLSHSQFMDQMLALADVCTNSSVKSILLTGLYHCRNFSVSIGKSQVLEQLLRQVKFL